MPFNRFERIDGFYTGGKNLPRVDAELTERCHAPSLASDGEH